MNAKKERRVPQLRFPEFEGEWEEKVIQEVGSFVKTNSLSRSNLNTVLGSLKNIHYGDIHVKYSVLLNAERENVPYVNQSIKIDFDDQLLNDGDLIIADASEDLSDIGKATEIFNTNQDVIAGLHTIVVRPFNKFARGFLGYTFCISSVRKQLQFIAVGAKVLGISKSNLAKLSINIPEKNEQEKIAGFLGVVDERVDLLVSKLEQLREYKKGVMQKIFNQEIRFTKADGTSYPDWEEKELGDIVDNVGGTALEKYVEENADFNFISIGNYTRNGKYIDNGQRIILNDKTNTKRLNKGDLVMVLNDKTAKGDIIGSTILIDHDKYIYNQRSERMITKNVNSLFIWYKLNSNCFRKKVFKNAQGATQIYVNFTTVKRLKINIPKIEEQEKIAEFLSSLDNKIEHMEKQLEQTKQYKKSLLQQMLV